MTSQFAVDPHKAIMGHSGAWPVIGDLPTYSQLSYKTVHNRSCTIITTQYKRCNSVRKVAYLIVHAYQVAYINCHTQILRTIDSVHQVAYSVKCTRQSRTQLSKQKLFFFFSKLFTSRGLVGKPLYPQLSGPCNRPCQRVSRVFTRRLTPNQRRQIVHKHESLKVAYNISKYAHKVNVTYKAIYS